EARVDRADDHEQRDDGAEHHELLPVGLEQPRQAGAPVVEGTRERHHAASPEAFAIVIAAPTASAVACARSNSATSVPFFITSTRSLMPSTSGSSLEIIRMPSPRAASALISAWISDLAPTSMPRVGRP